MAVKGSVKKTTTRRRDRKNIDKGAAHIHSSFNNTIVTISDVQGNVISPDRLTGASTQEGESITLLLESRFCGYDRLQRNAQCPN